MKVQYNTHDITMSILVDVFGLYPELSNKAKDDDMEGDMVSRLRARGHNVIGPLSGKERSVFGRAQVIVRNRETGN